METVLKKRLSNIHAETYDELIEKVETLPLKDDFKDEAVESDFEDAHSTNKELDGLYKLIKNFYFIL